VYGRRSGRIEHLAGALCKSPINTLDRSTAASTEVRLPGEAARVAIDVMIDVLMPFHTMTTTDSVESISGGLAKSPSEVLNPPSSSPKYAAGRV